MRARELQFQTCQKSSLDHLYLNYSKILGQAFEFYESNKLLVTACWEDIDSTVLPNQGNNRYGSQHWNNTPQISLLIKWCGVSWVYLIHCSETAGKAAFVSLVMGVWWQKQYISPVKVWEFQPQTQKKSTLLHLSLYFNKNSGQSFEFSERNRLLASSCWEVFRKFNFA